LDNYLNRNIKGNPNSFFNIPAGREKFDKPTLNKGFHTVSLVNKEFVKPLIKPLTQTNNIALKDGKYFSTLDIETISLKGLDNLQIPVIITSYSSEFINKIFIIDHIKLKVAVKTNDLKTINILVNGLWKNYINYILDNPKYFETVFAHNLGSFDGIFLYKGLLKNLDIKDIGSIIDDKNNFISITYNPKGKVKGVTSPQCKATSAREGENKTINFTWKDSYRIFPVSLDNLCKSFSIEGKISKYDPEFNDISIFSKPELYNKFIEYSKQDAKSLFNILILAQKYYITNYQVDLATVLSTSTLSLKIFRKMFLNTDIPIMNRNEDTFIRESYYGGATDFYKNMVRNYIIMM